MLSCFIRVVGNMLVQKYAGERARMVRELFQVRVVTMRCKGPCLRSSTSLMTLMLVAISVESLDGNEQVGWIGRWNLDCQIHQDFCRGSHEDNELRARRSV